ncbi:TolC family outer membrane protein [Xinfangfangia pollutisoli]|uniref:TolC family outer membrane protein n=1 Tax=Xinfangfangia pollutisoli TaxID=2865960 RepID=UPI001CD75560|nr:TolC family outer membrane protein [Xinfangfangia pollutisoli]
MRMWMRGMAVGLAVTLAGLPARAETLTDALISAYKNSNLLDQNEAVLRAADEDYAIAVSALRPVISYVVDFGNSVTRSSGIEVRGLSNSLSLSADLVLFDFGRTEASIVIAKESVLATRQALIQVEQEVLLSAVQSYVSVKLAQEIVALRQSNVRLITQELRAAQDRFDVGEITKTDVSIAEAALAAARSNLAAAEGDLLVARESYKAAVGHYPGRLAALPASPKIGKSLDEARSYAVKAHPAVKQAQHQVLASEAQVALAEANMKPTIGLGATITSRNYGESLGQSDSLSGNLGLQLNQTIYAGGKLSAYFRKALAGKESARAGLRQTVVQIEQNIGNAWANLSVYVASIEATQRQITAAQAAFDGVREEATLGARTTLDVLDAEQDLLDARASRLQAEANRYVAVYQVLAAMGLLTAEHLKLGIPTYDPEAYFNAVKSAPATSSRGRKLDEILGKIGK